MSCWRETMSVRESEQTSACGSTVPPDLRPQIGSEKVENYLSLLNQHVLTGVEKSGDAFLSNALIGGKFVLRACIVNFHTSLRDIEALPLLLSRLGEEADTTLRPERVKLGARSAAG